MTLHSSQDVSVAAQEGWRVNNLGDLNLRTVFSSGNRDHPFARHSNAVGKANEILAHTIEQEAAHGRFCLSLGGDHSMVSLGVVAALFVPSLMFE